MTDATSAEVLCWALIGGGGCVCALPGRSEGHDEAMARLAQIVVDSTSPSTLARFWEAALDDFEVRPYDQAEIERLAALGFTPDTDPTVFVDGPTLEICFQQVDSAPAEKRRVHLDLVAEDRPAEVERLVGLGARVRHEFAGHTWLIDPEGNDFSASPIGDGHPTARGDLDRKRGEGKRRYVAPHQGRSSTAGHSSRA